ncbi:MAG: hypothetical protein E7099_00905 [Mediterranea massiliensis]|nr:hypothetical protein [Mediterranea massiliensis]
MKEKLLRKIYKQLSKMEKDKLGLKDGQVGLMLFMARYTNQCHSIRSYRQTERLLNEVISDLSQMKGCLLHGSWGVLWALQKMIDCSILEKDEPLHRVMESIKFNCLSAYVAVPVRLVEEDYLFSEGICIAKLWKEEETLERYSIEERLITLVDECERLLTIEIPGIYTPRMLLDHPSLLHSMIHFLQQMQQRGIYPYKSAHLLQQVEAFCLPHLKRFPPLDVYLITAQLPHVETLYPQLKSKQYEELFRFLGEVGFYSLLYQSPELFADAYRHFEEFWGFQRAMNYMIKECCNKELLLGWGGGLL